MQDFEGLGLLFQCLGFGALGSALCSDIVIKNAITRLPRLLGAQKAMPTHTGGGGQGRGCT